MLARLADRRNARCAWPTCGAPSRARSHTASNTAATCQSRRTTTARSGAAFDMKASHNPRLGPMGLGLLVPTKLIDPTTLPKVVHCPSMNTQPAPHANHSMDTSRPNWWNGIGASWWDDPNYATRRTVVAYNYRSPSFWRVNNRTQLRTERLKAPFVLYSDMLDPRFGIRWVHRDGYNRVLADGSAAYFHDSDRTIERTILVGGVADGRFAPAQSERAFEALAK